MTDEVWNKVQHGDHLAFYSTYKWKALRHKALERDHYECQRCLGRYESKGTVKLTRATTVHHIIPMAQSRARAESLENLVSLCFQCHEDVEGRSGWQKKNKKPVTEERW